MARSEIRDRADVGDVPLRLMVEVIRATFPTERRPRVEWVSPMMVKGRVLNHCGGTHEDRVYFSSWSEAMYQRCLDYLEMEGVLEAQSGDIQNLGYGDIEQAKWTYRVKDPNVSLMIVACERCEEDPTRRKDPHLARAKAEHSDAAVCWHHDPQMPSPRESLLAHAKEMASMLAKLNFAGDELQDPDSERAESDYGGPRTIDEVHALLVYYSEWLCGSVVWDVWDVQHDPHMFDRACDVIEDMYQLFVLNRGDRHA